MSFKKKEFLITLILAVLVASLSGYFLDFPFRIFEPTLCIQLLKGPPWETCYPLKIYWSNALLDFLFWFVVLAAGWWVIKLIKTKKAS